MSTRSSTLALSPVAQRALRAKVVVWVGMAALGAALAVGGLWTWSSREAARAGFDRAASQSLTLAEYALARTFEAASREAAQVASAPALRAAAAGAAGPASEAALRSALASSRIFESGLLLDGEGVPLAWSGSDAGLAALVAQLQPRSATDADLQYVMRGVDLRKALSSQQAPRIRMVSLEEFARPLAGAPIHDVSGARIASFQGLVGPDSLARALTSDGTADALRIQLLDPRGRQVAAGEGPAGEWGAERSRNLDRPGAAGWRLVLRQPVSAGLLPVALPVAASLAVAVGLALVCGLLAFWRASRQVRPFWELYLALREARDGEPVEVPVPRVAGEAESLALAFNDTIQQLHRKRVVLQRELAALRDQNSAFQSQRRTLAQLTVTDPLTRLANRRSFEDQIKKEIKRLSRHDEGLSLLVVDIDDFKKINDDLGHAAGDECLVQVARVLKEVARETDLVARYGGEEFVVVAPGTDLHGATVLGERLRTAVAETSFIVEETKRPRRVTVSIGVATFRGSQTDLFNSADAALYEAKAAGKNCVQVAG